MEAEAVHTRAPSCCPPLVPTLLNVKEVVRTEYSNGHSGPLPLAPPFFTEPVVAKLYST